MQFLTSEQRKCRDFFSTAGDKSKHRLFHFYEIYKFKIQIEAECDSHGASVRAFKLSFDLDTQKNVFGSKFISWNSEHFWY